MSNCGSVSRNFSLKCLRYILSAAGLKADLEDVRAVLDMPVPFDVKGMRRFIRFVTYISEVCERLRRLVDKDTAWHLLPKHDAAVREIKQLVTMMTVLQNNVSRTVAELRDLLESNSSQHGMGCCLKQEGLPSLSHHTKLSCRIGPLTRMK